MDIHDFWMSVLIIHTSVDIHIDDQAGISMQGHSAMDIRKNKYSLMDILFMDISANIHALMDIHMDILGFLRISMDCCGFWIKGSNTRNDRLSSLRMLNRFSSRTISKTIQVKIS